MFDGVADHFHQFIASRTSLPIPLSFPLHNPSPTFTTFDPYPSNQTLHSHLLHQLHHPSPLNKDEEKEGENNILSTTNSELERERSVSDPWSNDEVLSLLRIRSSMESWFPDLTWEHVSRKLEEFGFKRSAGKCKEKFEEETRNFNSISFNKSRFFTELEEVYDGESPRVHLNEKIQSDGKKREEDEEEDKMGQNVEEDPINVTVANPSEGSEEVVKISTKSKKRKREKKFEMFKGFCIDIVNKMMAQQEEMHNKLLEDMVIRDEEKIAREEAWKKQEMERMNNEIEIRAHELAIEGNRQATIIELLKKFTTNSSENNSFETTMRYEDLLKVSNTLSSLISPSSFPLPQIHNDETAANSSTMVVTNQNSNSSTETLSHSNPSSKFSINMPKIHSSSTLAIASQNTNSSNIQNNPSLPTLTQAKKSQKDPNFEPKEREDIGKRWPKDEVLALINMRCSLYNGNDQDKEGGGGGAKGSLWERISQGMLGLGYKRSAKRCKEKWENINKYFRKTKDANKKRSVDSRTCPYFHQLSHLYNQGTLVAPADGPVVRPPPLPKTDFDTRESDANNKNGVDCGKNAIQEPAFNFEF